MVASERRPRVGILAVQGDVREHAAALREVGADPVEVRLPRDLAGVEALILPGGESTAMRRLIAAYGLTEPIRSLAASGAPMWGTCAGMILLAARVADGEPPLFGMLDIEVRRNAYGRQLSSFEADLRVAPEGVPVLGDEPVHAVFIRAPAVTGVGPGVEILVADPAGRPAAVRQADGLLATAFHPELTADRRFHRLVVDTVRVGAAR